MNQHDKNQLIVLAVILVCAMALMYPMVAVMFNSFNELSAALEGIK